MPTTRRTISERYFHTALIVTCILAMLWPRHTYAQTTIFFADFESSVGDNAWTFNGGATDGNWIIGQPNPYNTGAITMEIAAFGGTNDLLTGIQFIQDVDAGPTSARSNAIVISSGVTTIDLQYYFSYYINSSSTDYLDVELRSQLTNATVMTLISETGSGAGQDAVWTAFNQDISSLVGQSVYIYVASADLGNPSKVEAAIDNIEIVNTPIGSTPDCTVLISDDFEGGLGNWDDPGSDCQRINNPTFASNGNFSIRLRDNTLTSTTTSISLDLSTVDSALVDFSYMANSMEVGEDFWLQISTDGGISYSIVEDWIRNVDFDNNIRYFEQVVIPGPLTSDTRFRFVCDASGNGDQVYIDEIVISACEPMVFACPEVNLRDTTMCFGSVLLIDADPQGSFGTVLSHTWDDLDMGSAAGYILSDTNTQVVTIDGTSATLGTISLEYEIVTDDCTVTDTMEVTIVPLPTCQITSSIDTICSGDNLVLDATASPMDTYMWSTGATTPQIVISPGTTTTYIVTVTSSQGCVSTCSKTIYTEAMTAVINDALICSPDTIPLTAIITGGQGPYTHSWSLGAPIPADVSIINASSDTALLIIDSVSSAVVLVDYSVTDDTGCTASDDISLTLLSKPVCEILSDEDTVCSNTTLVLSAFSNYLVTPDSGMVISANSGVGFTQTHEIIGVQDPASTKVIITLPTWDDHFDTILLNGQMIIPEIFETASYNANGMNCLTPWIPNVNGLPRSILEISGTEVRYFSSLTTTSTVMTEIFPTNWTTTPQPFIEGTNTLQFGIQNTAGPVSGSWIVEAIGTIGYSYEWSTGDTTQQISVTPASTTTYQLTVTSPTGCMSTCDKTIYVGGEIVDSITYVGCSGDGYGTSFNGVVYDESNPIDTVVLTAQSGCDSITYIRLTYEPVVVVEAGAFPSPLCSNAALTLADLNPSITGGISTGQWTTSGGGFFDNNGDFGGLTPATQYTPSQSEIDDGKIILTLTSDDPIGSCEPEADAVMVPISDVRCSNFPWSGQN